MSKDLIPNDQHSKLVNKALPKAIEVLIETMERSPMVMKVEKDGTTSVEFSTRINGQRLRAALGTVSIVERLGDQALRKQAGTQLKRLLAEIRRERVKPVKILDHEEANSPAPAPVPALASPSQ